MFKNLSTSAKLFLLCSTFLVAIVAAISGLVAEKKIAIEFARRELVGTRYLDTVREAYAAILGNGANQPDTSRTALLTALGRAEDASALDTAELHQGLFVALSHLWSPSAAEQSGDASLAALAAAGKLAVRIGEDSNLTLDPDLDSYYLQDTVVVKLPALLSQLGQMQVLVSDAATADSPIGDMRKVDFLLLNGSIRANLQAVQGNLLAASRGVGGGDLIRTLEDEVAAMVRGAEAYVDDAGARVGSEAPVVAVAGTDTAYAGAVDGALAAWRAVQAELDRLLNRRIDGLAGKLYRSLMLTGALALISIVIALMTHRHIAQPLTRLAGVARAVRQTGDYNMRSDHQSGDEIGKLAIAFNEMLDELRAAREREAAENARSAAMRAEVARVSRLTSMGEMTASIAHEINQPLAAIVANGNAALRWLGKAVPDFDETQAALKRIVSDGHRASQVIKGIRAMFKKDGQHREPLSVNELIQDTLSLTRADLQDRAIRVQAELTENLPVVTAVRVQLQQVLLNLIANAAEAMASVDDRERTLDIQSRLKDGEGVLVTVADNGPGIGPELIDRIFEAFFTTKTSGMGMGLSICRSIVEAHGGRLWAEARSPVGSIFSILLPVGSGHER